MEILGSNILILIGSNGLIRLLAARWRLSAGLGFLVCEFSLFTFDSSLLGEDFENDDTFSELLDFSTSQASL